MDTVYLTKLITLIVYPMGLFVTLHVLAWLCRAVGRRGLGSSLIVLGWIAMLLASNPWVAGKLMQSLEQQFPQQPIETIQAHDAILVLGGGLRIPLPPATTTQLAAGSDRFWRAAQLYRAGKAPTIVLAGGNVFAQDGFKGEAHYAAELLQQWGVPADAIKIETASRNTRQNVSNVASWLSSQRVSRLLLVTSAYHMPRALWSFEGVPIKITPASADVLIRQSQQPKLLNWLPSAAALMMTTKALHEYYGIAFIQMQRILGRD